MQGGDAGEEMDKGCKGFDLCSRYSHITGSNHSHISRRENFHL